MNMHLNIGVLTMRWEMLVRGETRDDHQHM